MIDLLHNAELATENWSQPGLRSRLPLRHFFYRSGCDQFEAANTAVLRTLRHKTQEGRDLNEDEPCSGRHSSSITDENVDRIWNLLHSDHQLTARMIGEELNLTHTTVPQILTNELEV
ncbi:hypothetical protein J437_LFUL019094 [Ladona fulva]|uniref:Uncharacterized protein n=1 Tax=Ladona fulva TaxID=123851 RepID=A0A8K0PBI2_LADFU|nr:hypothetical protein J437_LFUL019094 [Ladona fulva]